LAGGGKKTKRQRSGDAEPADGLPSPLTDGDRLFAQKCRELQGFIRPLAELLNGLRTGRYEKGLSTFQQSVAMDRIQRIIGVLPKPQMGGRYLGTLLQVEMMLKLWFPHVAPKTAGTVAERRHRHAPVGVVPAGRGRPECPLPPPQKPACDMANHLRFIGRTVMVQNGNVEAAYGALNRRVGAGPRGARPPSGPAGRGLRHVRRQPPPPIWKSLLLLAEVSLENALFPARCRNPCAQAVLRKSPSLFWNRFGFSRAQLRK
uniref:Circadian-associated transcriptional repressor n=1 Tax=Apteryx owenii TaxID=8824 RepID=A0A8B9QN71_APTOW